MASKPRHVKHPREQSCEPARAHGEEDWPKKQRQNSVEERLDGMGVLGGDSDGAGKGVMLLVDRSVQQSVMQRSVDPVGHGFVAEQIEEQLDDKRGRRRQGSAGAEPERREERKGQVRRHWEHKPVANGRLNHCRLHQGGRGLIRPKFLAL